jgi:hypothetical protein
MTIPYRVNYDTINTDRLIATPSGTNRIAIVGMSLLNDAAYTLIFKSATNTIETFKFAANSGLALPFSPRNQQIYVITNPGEALNISCNAVLPPFTIYVVEL